MRPTVLLIILPFAAIAGTSATASGPVSSTLSTWFQNDAVPQPADYTAIAEGKRHATDRFVPIARRAQDLSNAVVGIETVYPHGNGNYTGRGSGFFVDRCHILTANHVAKPDGTVASSITVGWGPPPTSGRPTSGAVLSPYLAQSFSTVERAIPEWYGSSLVRQKDIDLETSDPGTGLHKAPRSFGAPTSGDWAILRIEQCRSSREPVFALPTAPFTLTTPEARDEWLSYAGYPDARYTTVTLARCLPFGFGIGGTLASCGLTPGGSGGVLMDRSGVAIGILSIGDGESQVFVPTKAAAAALSLGEQAPPKPGCIARVKQAFAKMAPTFPASVWGPPDDDLNAEGLRSYVSVAQGLSNPLGSQAAFFTPAAPDRLWCETLIAVGEKSVDPDYQSLSPGIDVGEWHDEKFDLIISKGKDGLNAGVRIHNRSYDAIKLSMLGRIVFVVALKAGVKFVWMVEFFPGKPPLLVSAPGEGFSLPRFAWMQPGRLDPKDL
jgi:hypothetical protein